MKVHTTLVGEEIIDTRSTFPHDSDEYIAEYLRNTCVVRRELTLSIAEIILYYCLDESPSGGNSQNGSQKRPNSGGG